MIVGQTSPLSHGIIGMNKYNYLCNLAVLLMCCRFPVRGKNSVTSVLT